MSTETDPEIDAAVEEIVSGLVGTDRTRIQALGRVVRLRATRRELSEIELRQLAASERAIGSTATEAVQQLIGQGIIPRHARGAHPAVPRSR